MATVETKPAALSAEAIQSAIAQYNAQGVQIQTQIRQLDEQRVAAVDALKQLSGAIAALEQLLKNKSDEDTAAAQKAEAEKMLASVGDAPQA